jgi:4-amino-4-deoxy-L-arabinose transferase-like glycosyltransferase
MGVRLLQATLAATGCLLILRLGERLFGRATALLAGLLYAVDPMLVAAAGLLYPEAVSAVLMLGIVLLTLRAAERDHFVSSAGAGVGLGLLAQLRPAALAVVPVVAAWSALAAANRRGPMHGGAVVLGCLVALAPWMYRNYHVHGGLVPIATAGTQHAPVRPQAVATHGLTSSIVRRAWEAPIPFASRMGRELYHFWELYPQRLTTDNPTRRAELHDRDARLPVDPTVAPRLRNVVSALTFGPELALAIIGLVVGCRTRPRETALLAAVILCYALGYAVFVAKLRYRITILPLVLLLAGYGAVAAVRRFRRGPVSGP